MMLFTNTKQNIIIVTTCIGIGIGIGIGIFVPDFFKSCKEEEYNYINPNLNCHEKYVVGKGSYIKLKNKLLGYIEEKKKNNEATSVSVYFRDLQNGPTLGINEHDVFSPASLLKLPLLLAYLNLQTEVPDLLDTKLVINSIEENSAQLIPPKVSIKAGEIYSIRELLERMMKYSDNRASILLNKYLRESRKNEMDLLKNTYIELGVVEPKGTLDETLSVKSYGSIFVQLYHSSYFNQKKVSDDALALLAESDYINGINKGVPSGVRVAHKFGERTFPEKKIVQLHDCGIVYYPKNPYLICIMTKGEDIESLQKIIGDISKMVYDEFDSRKL